jgi:MFS family permease
MSGKTYYGWWIVAAWIVLNVYWAGTLNYGLTVFFTPVRMTFGWDAAFTALVFSETNVLAGVLAPLVGVLFDRVGPRPLMLAACWYAGFGLLALSVTPSATGFVVGFTVVSVGVAIWNGMGLATIALWFRRRRGLASGIITAGSALGGLLVAVWQYLVSTVEWRETLLVAGVGMLVSGTLASSVLRHRPVDLGLALDGDRLDSPSTSVAGRATELKLNQPVLSSIDGDFGLRVALRGWQFWTLSAVTAVVLAGSTAATVLLLPRLGEAGVAPSIAVSAVTVAIVLGVVGRPGTGWLADRIPMRWLTTILISIQAIGLLAFALPLSQIAILVVFVIAFGLSNDVVRLLASVLVARFYGPRALGRILGILYLLLIPGRTLGPVVAGAFHDRGYGYGLAFLLFAALSLAMVIPAWLLKPPSPTLKWS